MAALSMEQKVEVYVGSYCKSRGVSYLFHSIHTSLNQEHNQIWIAVEEEAVLKEIKLPLPKELL